MAKPVRWSIHLAALALALSPNVAAAAQRVLVVDRNILSYQEFFNAIIPEFNQRYPDIQVEYVQVSGNYFEKLTAMLAAGQVPDVVWLNNVQFGQFYKPRGLLQSLDSYLRSGSGARLSDYFTPVMEQFKVEGSYFALPFGVSSLAVFYNVDSLAQAGLTPPSPQWTWDDYEQYLRRLTRLKNDGTVDQYGGYIQPALPRTSHFFEQNQVTFWDPKASAILTPTDRAVEVLQFFDHAVHELQALVPMGVNGPNLFREGKIALYQEGNWAIGDQRLYELNFPLGVALPPKRLQAATVMASDGYGILKQSANKEAAWKLISFITSRAVAEQVAKYLFHIPARPDSAHIWLRDPRVSRITNSHVFIDGVSLGSYTPALMPNSQEVREVYERILQAMWRRQLPPRLALEQMQRDIAVAVKRSSP